MQIVTIKSFRGHAHAHPNPLHNGTWEYHQVEAVGIIVNDHSTDGPMYVVNILDGAERKPGFAYVIDADEAAA